MESAITCLTSAAGVVSSIRWLAAEIEGYMNLDLKAEQRAEELYLIDLERWSPNDKTRLHYLLECITMDAFQDAEELRKEKHSWLVKKRQYDKLSSSVTELQNNLRTIQPEALVPDPARASDTASTPAKDKETEYFGYQEQYDMIKSSRDRTKPTQVVAIIGPGGMGKTELARQAFSMFETKEKEEGYHIVKWACLYGKFQEYGILAEILGFTDQSLQGIRLRDLRDMLRSELSHKRYLLVLDDVCYNESNPTEYSKAWNNVMRLLRETPGYSGSLVLMTTRAEICATKILVPKEHCINLNDGIIPDEMEKLLDAQNVHYNDDDVRKLYGSPLAAELFADNRTSWENDVANRLVSSFHDLPWHLKRCLAFCSIFPREWEFEHEKLAMMWVAHGFDKHLDPYKRNESEEKVARDYFNDLLQRSLFQKAGDRWKIYGHIHSMLLLKAAPDYYCRIDDKHELREINPTVRHLSVTTDCVGKLLEVMENCYERLQKLRTLLVVKKAGRVGPAFSSTDQIIGLLNRCRGVRVLDFPDANPHTNANPRIITADLLESMGSLTNVRYLAFSEPILVSSPRDVESLAKLNSLHGTLKIYNLQNVMTKKEAKKAKLEDKKHLEILKLKWEKPMSTELRNRTADWVVLEGLKPHPSLRELHIQYYQGKQLPTWLLKTTEPWSLQKLVVHGCPEVSATLSKSRFPNLEVDEDSSWRIRFVR